MRYDNPDPDSFNPLVWSIVRQIPAGQVSTYGQIASMIPPPDGIEPPDFDRLGPRWVGDAMNAVSRIDDPTIPWHRVINAKGGISLPPGSKSAVLQRQRLEDEGVLFGKGETVDLNTVGWEGPDASWLRYHGFNPPRPLRKPPEAGGQLPLF